MRAFSLIAAAAALFLSACDRHEWESKDGNMGTKELYVHHGDDHAGKGHDDHGKEDGHAEGEDHKKEEGSH